MSGEFTFKTEIATQRVAYLRSRIELRNSQQRCEYFLELDKNVLS